MIASLAAVGLAPGLGSTSRSTPPPIEDETPVAAETPVGLLTFDGPEKTIDTSKSYMAEFKTDRGDIVIALSPEAPQAANSLAFLAGNNFYDGLQVYWVLPGFDVQLGDPTCEATGRYSCAGRGGPGYTLPMEGDSASAGRWSVLLPAISSGSDQVHGSQLVIALTDEADFQGSVIGEVVEGQEILEALEERAPCFGSEPSKSNPCQSEDELPKPLIIEDVTLRPA